MTGSLRFDEAFASFFWRGFGWKAAVSSLEFLAVLLLVLMPMLYDAVGFSKNWEETIQADIWGGIYKRFTFFGMPALEEMDQWFEGLRPRWSANFLGHCFFFMETKLAFYDFQGVQSNFCASCQFQGIGVCTVRTEFGKLFGYHFFCVLSIQLLTRKQGLLNFHL